MTSVGFNPSSANAASMLDASRSAIERSAHAAKTGPAEDAVRDTSSYWSIATTMPASSLPTGSVQDANGLAAAITDTAAVGLEQATEIVAQIQQKLVQAKAMGTNKPAINAEIDGMKTRLATLVEESSFSGQNWLQVEAGQQPKVSSLLASVTSGKDGALSINMIDFDTAKSTLVSKENAAEGMLTRAYAGTSIGGAPYDFYLMDAQSAVSNRASAREVRIDASTSSDDLDGMISTLNRVLIDMVSASADVGSTRNQVSADLDFLEGLPEVTDLGAEGRIDGQMGEDEVMRAAKEAQTQLQNSALNIANVSMAGWLKIYL